MKAAEDKVIEAAKLAGAHDYLAVAPKVVNVVRDLELPSADDLGARIAPVADGRRDALEALADEWNLSGTVGRVLTALDRA